MGILQRLGSIFNAKANAGLDQLENPVEMTQQVIRDLKEKLNNAVEAEARVKSIVIQNRKEAETQKQTAAEWVNKAKALDAKAAETEGEEKAKIESLIVESLKKSQEATNESARFAALADNTDKQVMALNGKVKELKNLIESTENDLTTLQARMETAEATQSVNKELNNLGSDNTMDTLNRMRKKVADAENIAQAYTELDNMNQSTSQEIDALLKTPAKSSDADMLAAFRASK